MTKPQLDHHHGGHNTGTRIRLVVLLLIAVLFACTATYKGRSFFMNQSADQDASRVRNTHEEKPRSLYVFDDEQVFEDDDDDGGDHFDYCQYHYCGPPLPAPPDDDDEWPFDDDER